MKLDKKSVPKVISLLLMLANLRIKSFPKILGIIESILQSNGQIYEDSILEHLEDFLVELKTREMENSYLISWIVYFIKSNKLENKLKDKTHSFENPIVKTIHEDTLTFFNDCSDFKIFSDVATVSKNITLLEHLDVFKPQ
ncbi:hypothetical protein NG799_28185 [Laspinema sp. D1]|uniref:Uncharacterized protein n=1 Tax=Laspinema palackyanum D2a TaxID=2953684 RepID=A0ABT2MZL4_9CYAN|nr:hypothetical protein [Laspinema sp. D2a]